jgi:hypothetical protein
MIANPAVMAMFPVTLIPSGVNENIEEPYKEKYGQQVAHVFLIVLLADVWNGNLVTNI